MSKTESVSRSRRLSRNDVDTNVRSRDMKSLHYIAIFIRLFALGLVALSLRETSLLIEAWNTGGINGVEVSMLYRCMSVLSPLAIALVIWFFPMAVASAIVPESMDKTPEPISTSSSLYIVIAGIGLFILSYALVDLAYWLTLVQLISDRTYQEGVADIIAESRAGIVATIFEIAFSLGLVLWSKSVSNVISKVAK